MEESWLGNNKSIIHLHRHNFVASINIQNLTCNAASQITTEKGSGILLHLSYSAPQGAILHMMNHIKIPPTAEEARVRIGPAEMAFTNILWSSSDAK